MLKIHPTAIIGKEVKLGNDVEIGAYSVLQGNISVGDGTVLKSHVNIEGEVKIGSNNKIYPFVSIGTPPQDAKFENERSAVSIGNNNIIREHVTINGGSKLGNSWKGITNETIIGNNCYLYINAHIAHDVILTNNITITNNVALAGHILIEDNVIIGGNSAIHQFIKIGKNSMIGGMCAIGASVLPYSMIYRKSDKMNGLNIVGMKRAGISNSDIAEIKSLYGQIFNKNDQSFLNKEKMLQIKSNGCKFNEIIDFILDSNHRGFIDFEDNCL